MGALSITGKTMGSTSLNLKTGSITKTIPVTVKSTNLLSYGPAEASNLKATVTADGSLDLSSAGDVEVGRGVQWELDMSMLIGRTVTLSYEGSVPSAMIASVRKADTTGGASVYQGKNNQSFTVDASMKTLILRVYKGGSTAGPVSGNLKITLNEGTTALPWMRPDDTTLAGGGDLS
ncbi:hypothetical protein [Bifidobacterium platyrrhinorum]|uniref:Uncharacterized protein n=1 Tax=Bifidobacterium platyrrhinorum TaxID=2661628 RepID=A0A6L9SU28_9BIFI|nr:hypothetical protein [Bifidobacterium platyrrhinorum]NEG56117.1 hypothetical protein [Bifidobacterium platyrrhinorum]